MLSFYRGMILRGLGERLNPIQAVRQENAAGPTFSAPRDCAARVHCTETHRREGPTRHGAAYLHHWFVKFYFLPAQIEWVFFVLCMR